MAKTKAVVKEHPYIERRRGVRGGAPVIAGTGIRVLDVAIRYEVMGMTPEEIMVALPHLALPQIHARAVRSIFLRNSSGREIITLAIGHL